VEGVKLPHSSDACDRRVGLHTAFVWSGERSLSGFVVDPSDLARKFVVELLIDGLSVKVVRADEFAHELVRQNIGDGCYGFSFFLRDELVNGALVAEARIANLGTIVGSPIVFNGPPRIGRSTPVGGSVRWLGGLRFSGWVAENTDEPAIDVVVDGVLVTQVEASGWTHIGADPEIACAVRAFGFHLPEKFADGRARRVAVVKRNGDNLLGSPLTFVAFAGGLANMLAAPSALESERLRAEQFDRLVPMSLPLSEYRVWCERFPLRRLGPGTMRAAVAMVGAGNIDVTLASLHQQTQHQWMAASFPEAAELNDFDPELVKEFLNRDAADSDFVVFALSGTALAPTALERIAAAFVKFDRAQAVYGDIDFAGAETSVWPLAFPAFDYERLLEQGYCAHCFALRRVIAERALASGASDLYRLFNCIFDHVTTSVQDVVHVPGAIAALPEFDLNTRRPTLAAATRTHLIARGIVPQITPVASGVMPAVRVSRPADSEKTTIIIPTRNRRKLLQNCFESIQPAVKKRATEIIVVDNDSSDADTLEYLAALDGKLARVMRVTGEFNFARLNNIAAHAATGDSLCLLNNDIQALDGHWLDEMLGRLAGVDVGAVGALLMWPSGIVQHGGVVLGPGFAATHAFNDRISGDVGYCDLLCVAHECSCVTAACLVTRRTDYLAVGGMDELRFPVNFNDVDYCLKLRGGGKRIVFTPHAKLLHLESASRGNDKARDSSGRFERELQNLRTKWGDVLVADSYYNPMLSLDPIPFSALAWPPREMEPRLVTRPKPVLAPPGI
jgi:O-antigen biosynthesis protein